MDDDRLREIAELARKAKEPGIVWDPYMPGASKKQRALIHALDPQTVLELVELALKAIGEGDADG